MYENICFFFLSPFLKCTYLPLREVFSCHFFNHCNFLPCLFLPSCTSFPSQHPTLLNQEKQISVWSFKSMFFHFDTDFLSGWWLCAIYCAFYIFSSYVPANWVPDYRQPLFSLPFSLALLVFSLEIFYSLTNFISMSKHKVSVKTETNLFFLQCRSYQNVALYDIRAFLLFNKPLFSSLITAIPCTFNLEADGEWMSLGLL